MFALFHVKHSIFHKNEKYTKLHTKTKQISVKIREILQDCKQISKIAIKIAYLMQKISQSWGKQAKTNHDLPLCRKRLFAFCSFCPIRQYFATQWRRISANFTEIKAIHEIPLLFALNSATQWRKLSALSLRKSNSLKFRVRTAKLL